MGEGGKVCYRRYQSKRFPGQWGLGGVGKASIASLVGVRPVVGDEVDMHRRG